MAMTNNSRVVAMFAVVVIPALLATISAAAAGLHANISLPSEVAVQIGHDVILPFTFHGDLNQKDDVQWKMKPLENTSSDGRPSIWRKVFAYRSNTTRVGYNVNQTVPGQFDLVLRNASRSSAGTYMVTVGRVGDVMLSASVEVRVMSVVCSATLTGDRTTLECSVGYTDSGLDHPEVHWSGSSTYCEMENKTTGRTSGGERFRTATCSGESNRVWETNRTCVVRLTETTVGHNSDGSFRMSELSFKCSVDFPVERGHNTNLESPTKPTDPVARVQLKPVLTVTDMTDSRPSADHQRANGSAALRAVNSSGLGHYLLFGLFTFVRHRF